MLTNPDALNAKKFNCGRVVGEYLADTCKLPVLGFGKNGEYVFLENFSLKNALKKAPFFIKLAVMIEGHEGFGFEFFS